MPAHWYPPDIHQRARIDEFCAWHHNAIRVNTEGIYQHQVVTDLTAFKYIYAEALFKKQAAFCHMKCHYFAVLILKIILHNTTLIYDVFLQVIEPRAKNIPIDHEKVRVYKGELEKSLNHIEKVFLKDQSYLCGNEISIADLLGTLQNITNITIKETMLNIIISCQNMTAK